MQQLTGRRGQQDEPVVRGLRLPGHLPRRRGRLLQAVRAPPAPRQDQRGLRRGHRRLLSAMRSASRLAHAYYITISCSCLRRVCLFFFPLCLYDKHVLVVMTRAERRRRGIVSLFLKGRGCGDNAARAVVYT